MQDPPDPIDDAPQIDPRAAATPPRALDHLLDPRPPSVRERQEGRRREGGDGLDGFDDPIGRPLEVRSILRPEVWGVTLLHAGATTLAFAALALGAGAAGLALFSGVDLVAALIIGFALSFAPSSRSR
ncbi:MAG TPA: hypothetical protein PKW35_23640 [Nannocystaceae bacterium]|nr:hypothetical protein [Nannocystaceae bacterium]